MSRKVKIISWNIKNNASLGEVCSHLESIHAQHAADIYLLQELTVNSIYNPETDAHTVVAETLNYDHRFVVHSHKVIRFQEGVGVFTNLPIKDEHSYLINERRAILEMKVKINGEFLRIVNLHITAPAYNPVSYKKEAKLLPDILARYKDKTVIGGDFNSLPNTKLLKKLDEQFDIVGRSEPTWQSKYLKNTASVDYAMSTPDVVLGEHKALDPGPSDHFPIYFEVSL